MGAYGAIIAKTLEKRVAGWIEPRRAAKIQCQRLARGHLARKKVAWLRKLANRAAPLNRLRWAFRVYMCFLPGLRYLMARAMAIRVQREARRIKATQEVTKRKEAIPKMQALSRRRAANRHVGTLRKMVLRLQTYAKKRADAGRAEAELLTQTNGAFNAAFLDDTDALASLTDALPELLLVRQNRHGQRASLAHALAAGGSVRAAPQLFLAMFGRAVAAGRATAPTFDADDGADVRTEAELHAAATYCAALRDADGRTPLHYAARWGELGFLQWLTKVLTLRPAAKAQQMLASAPPPDEGVAAGGADPEVRRGIFPAVLPSGEFAGMRKKCLVVLGQTTLRLYTLPAGASDAAKAAEAAEAGGKPSLSLTCDKLLYRRSTERSKRYSIEVVIMKKQNAKLKQLAAFETQASEDVLEIYPTATGSTAAAEVRGWMAALHSPRYLLARGMHLVSHVSGGGQAASQLDVWGRWAVVNRRDGRGEALLHQALRGVVAGEEAERGRLVGWLCDQGAMLFDGADPIDDDDGDGKKKKGVLGSLGKSMRKMSLTPRDDGSAQPARYGGSSFELILQLASREGC